MEEKEYLKKDDLEFFLEKLERILKKIEIKKEIKKEISWSILNRFHRVISCLLEYYR